MSAPRYASLGMPPTKEVLLDEILGEYPKLSKKPDCASVSYKLVEFLRIRQLLSELEREYDQKL